MGLTRFRQVLFENKVQQRLSMSRDKRLIIQNGDTSLQGLVIDWHLAENDGDWNNPPISNYEPTYAYAA